MDIGILGGTFSPIHNAHIRMADGAYKELGLDRVIIMPSGCPPHKNASAPAKDRLNMARLAIKHYPYMTISDYEIRRNGTTYTADTLSHLKKEHPDNNYIFIVGADSFVYMDKWYHPEIIFRHAGIAVCSRTGISDNELNEKQIMYEKEYNANVIILNVECIDVSSSEVRKAIADSYISSGSNILSLVPAGVLEYIYRNKLYQM